MRASVAAAIAAATFAFGVPAAHAQVLYKWTDRAGNVVYSDKRPPKGFQGTVTPMLPDEVQDPVPRDGVKRTAPPPSAAKDMATTRRETRERLQGDIDVARARLEAARNALEDAQTPGVDDRHVIQQRQDGSQPATTMAGAPGGSDAVLGGALATPLPRPNCKSTKGANGKESMVCSRSVPSEEYYARVEKLELAVREAQAQLDVALQAYRRGVD